MTGRSAEVGTVIVKGTEEWHEIDLKRMLDGERGRAFREAYEYWFTNPEAIGGWLWARAAGASSVGSS